LEHILAAAVTVPPQAELDRAGGHYQLVDPDGHAFFVRAAAGAKIRSLLDQLNTPAVVTGVSVNCRDLTESKGSIFCLNIYFFRILIVFY
jgi:hypothetical protein